MVSPLVNAVSDWLNDPGGRRADFTARLVVNQVSLI
jgi:hypothetical protein